MLPKTKHAAQQSTLKVALVISTLQHLFRNRTAEAVEQQTEALTTELKKIRAEMRALKLQQARILRTRTK